MHPSVIRRLALAAAGLFAAHALAVAVPSGPIAAQPRQASAQATKAEKPGQPVRTEQAIALLVNDEPITGYEIQQRARFIALNQNISEQVKENFKKIAQSESTNQRVRAILEEVIRANPGKTREQIGEIFEKRKNEFAMSLQKQALDGARNALIPKFRQEALEELIEERLKLQEAKRNGI